MRGTNSTQNSTDGQRKDWPMVEHSRLMQNFNSVHTVGIWILFSPLWSTHSKSKRKGTVCIAWIPISLLISKWPDVLIVSYSISPPVHQHPSNTHTQTLVMVLSLWETFPLAEKVLPEKREWSPQCLDFRNLWRHEVLLRTLNLRPLPSFLMSSRFMSGPFVTVIFLILKSCFITLCVWWFCLCVCLCATSVFAWCPKMSKSALDLLEPEWQMVGGHHVGAGIWPWSFPRAASVLNH